MKAVVLYAPRNVAVGELPIPSLGAGDVEKILSAELTMEEAAEEFLALLSRLLSE